MNELHSLLKRQLRRFIGNNESLPAGQAELLQAVNEAYLQFDVDRRMLENSLELTSQELLERNSALSHLNAELEMRVAERTASLRSSVNFIHALYQVAQSVITLENLPEVLQSVADVVAQTLAADRVTLIIFDHAARQVTHLVRAGPGVENVVRTVSYPELMDGLSGWVLRESRPAISPKGQLDPRESPAVQQRRIDTNCGSIVVLPLLYLGEALGTLTAINTPEQPDFTGEEVAWMETIATQAASAIGRAQIYDQLKKAILLLEQQRERLQAERDLLQALMDNIPDTIYFKDTASRFTRINTAQAKMLGLAAPEDAIGKTDLDFQHSELAQEFYEEEQRIIETGEPLINRIEFNPTKDGQPRWLAATKVPIKDSNDRVIGLVGVSRDITQRMQAEEALRQSEERFRLMSWATKDAVWDWDLKTNLIWWGEGLQKISYYSSQTIQSSAEWRLDHIHPEDRAKVNRAVHQALEGGMEFWSKEYRFRRNDGTYADVMDRAYILRDDRGKPYRMIGAMLDITERKQNEEIIRRQNDMLSSLHQITLDLLRYRELDPLLSRLVELSVEFMDAPYVEIMLVEGETLVVEAATQNQPGMIGQRLSRADARLSWQAFDTREPAVLSNYADWPHRKAIYEEFPLCAVADFPILNDDQCLGVLALGREKPDYEFTFDQIQSGLLFASLTALVLNNAQLREALREQSIRDPLTGLFNRRYMEEALNQQLSRVSRTRHPLGVIMMDIDHFKQVNDTYGHAMGDALLRELGQLLISHVRAEDIACRYGGEEFIVIMPDASLAATQERAEFLRQVIRTVRVQHGGLLLEGITLSLGVAIYPQHGQTKDDVLRAADAALYGAKQAGRDRVVVA